MQRPLSQFGAAAGQSLSFLHWTQRSPTHIEVGAAQLVSAVHCTHFPLSVQTGVAVPAHCALDVHCTQLDVTVLQWGAAAGHCASPLQPARHLNSSGSQMGEADPQSRFDVHCTH